MPPSLMFGHEMFSSIAATPSASDSTFATSTYSSSVVPQMLTNTVAPAARSSGRCSLDEAVHADALQADGVQHAGGRLDDARRRVAFALGNEQPLHADAAERGQIDDVGVLEAVAEAAAGGDDRVPERQRCRSSS